MTEEGVTCRDRLGDHMRTPLTRSYGTPARFARCVSLVCNPLMVVKQIKQRLRGAMGTKAIEPAPADPASVSEQETASSIGRPVRLIFVEDNNEYREVVTAELVDLGFMVNGFADGRSMLEAMAHGLVGDVIVLDWDLPGMSGVDLLPQLQRDGIQLPVIFLTGRSSPSYEHLAFDRGALDFIDKARGVEILAKRIRVIIEASRRRAGPEVEEIIQHCGRLMLKPGISRAFWDMVDVNLTVTEFKIVQLLALNVGQSMTYRSLFDCVHGTNFFAGPGEKGYQNNVRTTIKRIRNKFRAVDPEFCEIENVTSVGYSWTEPKPTTPATSAAET